jgi:predicted phage tail component-like protein
MAFKITFNGADIPSFIGVRTVDYSVLPKISHEFKSIAGGRGLLEAGTSVGEKIIKMKIVVLPDTGKSLTEMTREFGFWLLGTDTKTHSLVISDDATMTYQAKINNSVDITDLIYAGEGELEWIVPSGVGKSSTTVPVTVNNSTKTMVITYNGSAPTQPVITWTPATTLTGVTQVFTNTGTGKSFSITGTFTAGVAITVDFAKKVVKRGSTVDMLIVNYSSDWLTLPSRGTYTITGTQAGTYTCTASEYWL